jgi:Holliday junction resolvase
MNSNQKGKRGERELSLFLKDNGHHARRSQQYCGNTGGQSADIVCDSLDFLHIECKRVESFSLYPSLKQAIRDSGEKIASVWHKKNHEEWVVVIRAEDFLHILNQTDLVSKLNYRKALEAL